MTRHTLKIAALRMLLLLMLIAIAGVARAATYYIDYASGSNSNNGLSKSTPWKSHPYMSCGSAPTYSHAVGDHFIFKGGVTWPAACFPIGISTGGNSSTQDYYGVDVTWFAGASFARPVFDAAQTVIGHFFYLGSVSYVTIDNFEMKNQNIGSNGFGSSDAISAQGSTGNIVENVYIHDFITTHQISNSWVPDYASGGILGYVTLLNSTIDDSGGYGFNSSGTQINGGNLGGACENCREVSNSKFVKTSSACFGVTLCHDTEVSGVNQNIWYGTNPVGYGCDSLHAQHTQIVEDENGIGGFTVYNMWIHDNPDPGLTIFVGYKGSQVYNNVLGNNGGPVPPIDVVTTGSDSSSSRGYVYNNTSDSTAAGVAAIAVVPYNGSSLAGQVDIQNNITLGGGVEVTATGTVNQSNNHAMTSTEASTYGFTLGNKYKPSSSDPSVSGQGANLTSSCTGSLALLCQDTSGAAWFGGAYITRPTGSTAWDLGAFMGQGGTTGPPLVSFTSPSAGTVSGTQTLTVTATPQGSATISSCQFTIDGFPFGSALTISPYTLSWNSATAANAAHVLGASCTDSNAQVGTASTVTVTISNSMPGCFVSTDNDSGALSWTANQSFTAQSANFTATFTATPNSAGQDSVIALSQSPINAYAQAAALIRFNSTGQIDVYKGSISNYAADATVNYSPGTTYAFTYTIHWSAGTYDVAITSPVSVALATGYTFRVGAPIASLGYINAVSDNTTPDTADVCNFQIGSAASLSFSPASLNFGNLTVGSNATQTITATTVGGTVNFSSVAISGNADFTINSNTCTASIPSSCATQIKFAPTSPALETATVTFTDDATGSPQTVAVSGTGVPATPTLSVSPASVNFGGVQVHVTSSSGPIVLSISSGPVTFTGTPSLSGANAADFALASNTCTGTVSTASCQTVVSFTPSAVGAESAALSYADNATGSPQSVALSGTGFLAPHPPTAIHATVQ